ncbi:MAG: HEAT repeat domain-containing protein [Planctomycetota bacterium]
MRTAVWIALFVLPVSAQSLPRASEADAWESLHNKKRLQMAWEVPPRYAPTQLPDGTTRPPRAPWPFLVYVFQHESKAYERLRRNILNDTRFVLACHAVRPVEIKPHQVVELPYLAGVRGIRDPTLIVLDRDFRVVGSIHRPKEFEAKHFLPLLVAAADGAYRIPLTRYIAQYVKLLKEEEKLWKEGREIEDLRARAIEAIEQEDPVRAAKFDQKADAREAALAKARAALDARERALRKSLVPKGEAPAPLPTTGRNRRPLTPAEAEAVETYRTFARNRNPIVRAAAVEDLGAIDSAAMVEVILTAANDVDPRVVEAAGRALGRMRSAAALEAMQAGLARRNAKARLAALLGFADLPAPHPPAVPRLAASLEEKDAELRRAAVLALENQGDAAAAEALVAVLSDPQPGLRVVAATALGTLEAARAAPALAKALAASDWSLRKAAAEALARIRVKESIAPLLRRFEQEQGLMREVVYQALVAITGQDFRYRVENWRAWWEQHGAGFEVPSERAIADARRRAARALEGYAQPDKRRYHKIETLSRRMVFLIDISASMRNKIVLPPQVPDEVRQEFPSRVKMEIARKELLDILAAIDPHVYFNIITFAGEVRAWQRHLVPGSMRTAAVKFVSRLQPLESAEGSGQKGRQKTNTYGALMAAFGLKDEPVPDWRGRRSEADTIFLVTDGIPTTGKIVEVPRLVDAITALNRTRGAVIHVVVFDEDAARKLGPLAARNGGRCVVRSYRLRR